MQKTDVEDSCRELMQNIVKRTNMEVNTEPNAKTNAGLVKKLMEQEIK